MRKSETLNLRVSTDFKERLFEEAKKERRSVTNYLEATLTKLWQRKDSVITGRSRRRKKVR
jgi:predicted HicB family RNase H-like nuclease